MDIRFDGAQREIERGGDFLVGASLHMTQHDAGAILRAQLRNGDFDGRAEFLGFHLVQSVFLLRLEIERGRFHFSSTDWWLRGTNQYAYAEDYLQTFVSASSNIWFSFVGTDLTVLGFNRANTALTVVIDGVNRGTFDMTPEFSEQPFALHFPNLGEGAHIVQVHVPSTARVDAFKGEAQ